MLRATDLSKHFDLEPLFEHLDLTLSPGDRVGLVGPNGTGKSTLLAILLGATSPTSGAVTRSPGLRVGWQQQESPDPGMPVGDFVRSGAPALTEALATMHALEAAMSGSEGRDPRTLESYGERVEAFELAGGWAAVALLDQVRSRLGVAVEGGISSDRPMGTLSGGEQARVMLARLLVEDPDVLLLDEPTNHLDAEGRTWLSGYLAGYRGAVLVVSHDRRFLDTTVTRVLELDGISPALQDYPGCGYTAYRIEREKRWQRLLLDFEAQEKYRRQLAADIEWTKAQAHEVEVANPRNPGLRRYAKKVARKAISRERRLERQMQAASWIALPQTRPRLVLAGFAEQDVVVPDLPLVDIAALDVRAGGHEVVHGARVYVGRSDRILLTGRNGAGKTSLLRALAPRLSGALVLPQTHDALPLATRTVDFFRSQVPMYVDEAEEVLRGFLFDEHDQARRIGDLSVGQVRRLLLATLVNRTSRLLVLDEPTNHLDFDALDVVERALTAYRGALIVVSHDMEFAERIGITRRWSIEHGRLESAA